MRFWLLVLLVGLVSSFTIFSSTDAENDQVPKVLSARQSTMNLLKSRSDIQSLDDSLVTAHHRTANKQNNRPARAARF